MFDRNSSVLNSFFERERQRLASINRGQTSSDDNENVFNIGESIRKKNEQLKREYLELKLTNTAAPAMPNGFEDDQMVSIFQRRKKDDEGADGASVELQNLPKI
jgi:hypothetical protein